MTRPERHHAEQPNWTGERVNRATTIRPARPADAAAVAAIYNEGVEGRQSTFETDPRGPEAFRARMGDRRLPLLVAEEEGRVVGWAGLTPYSERPCYAGVAEFSIYIEAPARGRGVGRLLLESLVDESERRGYWKLIGLLFPTNAASVALCRAAGCRVVGTHRRHGQLEGEWRDVVVVERLIGAAAG